MASRSPDLRNLFQAFQGLGQSNALLAQRRRQEKAQKDARRQALLTLAGTAAGTAVAGPAGASFGAGAASLLGPQPDIGRAAQFGFQGFQMGEQAEAREAATARQVQREEDLAALQTSLQPVTRDDLRFEGTAVTQPSIDRGEVASRLVPFDPGAAARVALQGEGRGAVGKPPKTTLVDITNAQGDLLLDDNGVPLGNAVTRLEAREIARGNPDARIRKFSEKRAGGLSAEQRAARGVANTILAGTGPLSVDEQIALNEVAADLDPSTAANIAKTRRAEKPATTTAATIPAHQAVNLVGLRGKAIRGVINISGREDLFDAFAQGGRFEDLAKIGSIEEKLIQQEYKKLLQLEIRSTKPESEKAVARTELKRVNTEIKARAKNVQLARFEFRKAKTQQEKDAVLAQAEALGLRRSEIEK